MKSSVNSLRVFRGSCNSCSLLFAFQESSGQMMTSTRKSGPWKTISVLVARHREQVTVLQFDLLAKNAFVPFRIGYWGKKAKTLMKNCLESVKRDAQSGQIWYSL